jgi:hypothetical protein
MAEKPEPAPELKEDDPRVGLMKFYSSQARLMLEQYDNITDLLGETSDFTAPGTHCEVLLRNFLRGYLTGGLRADKGFILGRRPSGGTTEHCPEIDIVIHDDFNHRPVFRLEDFVIVKGVAAKGAIQVKRCMRTNLLADGIDNVVSAKEHFRHTGGREECGRSHLFSAVLFFEEQGGPRKDGRPKETYANCLREKLAKPALWPLAPDVVGSLKGHIFFRTNNAEWLQYYGIPAVYGDQNISLQVLMAKMSEVVQPHFTIKFPVAIPRLTDKDYCVIDFQTPGEGEGG